MSDKVQLIKEEILSYKESMKSLWPHSDFRRGQITAYNHILQFIDSLPKEPASEDLEEAAQQHSKQAFNGLLVEDNITAFKAGAEWQKQKDQETIELAEDHAMLAGMNKMKEELMKNAVETTIVNDWQYGKDPDHAIIPAIHQRIEGFNVGEKVKIIIVKEE